jgi:hypothetical protein
MAVVANSVHCSGVAAGSVVDQVDRVSGEEGVDAASHFEVVGDVVTGFGQAHAAGGGSDLSGAAWPSARCGRWSLKCATYSVSTAVRW